MRPVVTACGNLTKKPLLETTQKGTPVVRFTVACNAGKDDDATFLWCVAYGEMAKTIAKHFDKGQGIIANGLLRQYKDDKGGEHFVCDVRDFGFVGSSRRNDTPPVDDRRDNPPPSETDPF